MLKIKCLNKDFDSVYQKTNPIGLYLSQVQGIGLGSLARNRGGVLQISHATIRVYTGVSIEWQDPSLMCLITAVEPSAEFSAMRILEVGKTLKSSPHEISLTVTSATGDLILIPYGAKIAELSFIQLAKFE